MSNILNDSEQLPKGLKAPLHCKNVTKWVLD